MSENRASKYERIKFLKERIESSRYLKEEPNEKLVESFMSTEADCESVNSTVQQINDENQLGQLLPVTEGEIYTLLNNFKREFSDKRFNLLISDCKETTVNQVITTFGLGHFMSKDTFGGEVSTVHNAKQGIFANDTDKQNFSSYEMKFDRKEWDNKKQRGKSYEKTNRKLDSGEVVKDDYTNDNLEKGNYDQDHVTPLKKLNDKASLHLYMNKDQRKDIANSKSNLAATNKDLNRHGKRAKTNYQTIQKDETVTKYNINKGKMISKQIISESAIFTKTALEVSKRVASTGADKGLSMGIQQSVGMLISEFTTSIFDEIMDIYKNGFKSGKIENTFFKALRERLERIAKRVLSKWKNVVVAFKDGAISGFMANLISFVVNCFKTTSGRITRIVREGFMSLIKAFKLILNPPGNMSSRQIAHEVTKLVGAAIVTTGGILIEESVQKFLESIPFLAPVAEFISVAIVGLATGLMTTFVIYGIDKLDLFGVIQEEFNDFKCGKLNEMIDTSIGYIEQVMIDTSYDLIVDV